MKDCYTKLYVGKQKDDLKSLVQSSCGLTRFRSNESESKNFLDIGWVFLSIVNLFIAGFFKSQLIDYFRRHIVFWDKSLQFYAN